MAVVDDLQIKISAESSDARKQLDLLAKSLTSFQSSIRGGFSGANMGNAITNIKALSFSFSHANNSTKSLNKSISSLGKDLGRTIKRFANFATATAAFSKSIKSSMDYVETLNYFNAAYRQVAGKAVGDWASLGYDSAESYYKSFSERAQELTAKMTGFKLSDTGLALSTGQKSLGIDPNLLMNYQAEFAQMSSSMGIASETALRLSDVLTEIGGDLASVKNMDFKKVWEDMASGLAGMSRTLDKYGVNIRNVNLQQKLNSLGIKANITALNQNEKALLRSIILLDSTRYAWGDLSNTLYQPANQFRLLQSGISNLARTIGNLFLPLVAKVLPYLNMFVKSLQNIAEWIGTLLGIDKFNFDGFTSGAGQASDVLSDIYDAADEASSALDKVESSAKKAKNGIRSFDKLNIINSGKTSSLSSGLGLDTAQSGILQTALDSILDEYQKAWDKAYEQLEERNSQFAENIKAAYASDGVKGIGSYIGKSITDSLNSINWDGIKQKATGFSTGLANFLNGLISPDLFGSVGSTFAETLNTVIQTSLAFGKTFDFANLGESIAQGFNSFVSGFNWGDFADNIDVWVQGAFTTIKTAITNIDWSKVWDGIKDFISHIDIGTIEIAVAGIALNFAGDALASGDLIAMISNFSAGSEGAAGAFGGITAGAAAAAAITAVVAGLALVYATNEDVRKSFKESISAITDNLTPAMEFLTTTVIPDLQSAWTGLVDILTPIGEFLTTSFTSIWQDMLNPALQYIGDNVLPKLQTAFENLWNNVLVPFGTFLGNVLKPAIQIVADILTMLWQNVVVPLAKALGSVLGAAFDAIVDTMNFVVEQTQPVIEVFNFLWDNVLSPIVTHLWGDLKPAFETVFKTIGNIITNLGTTLKGLIKFVSGVFTGDWKKAWDGVKDIFKGVWNGIVGIAEGAVNLLIDGLNGFMDGFGLVSGIADAIGINFKPSKISHISIPRLETGGYVPSRYTMFMAGENGIPEIAGTVGGKTAVAGGAEITGIKDAIYKASQEEMALLRQQNQLLQGILQKEFGITTDQVGRAARQYASEQYKQKHKNVFVF